MPFYLQNQIFKNNTRGLCNDLHIILRPSDVILEPSHHLTLTSTSTTRDPVRGTTTINFSSSSNALSRGDIQVITFSSVSSVPSIAEWYWTFLGAKKGLSIKTGASGSFPMAPIPPAPPGTTVPTLTNIFRNLTGFHASDLEIYFVEPDAKLDTPLPLPVGPWTSGNFSTVNHITLPSGGSLVALDGGTGVPSGGDIELEFSSRYRTPSILYYHWSFPPGTVGVPGGGGVSKDGRHVLGPPEEPDCGGSNETPWEPPKPEEEPDKEPDKGPEPIANWGSIGFSRHYNRHTIPLAENATAHSGRQGFSSVGNIKRASTQNFRNNQRHNQQNKYPANYYPSLFYQQKDYRSFLDILPKKMNEGETNYYQKRNRH